MDSNGMNILPAHAGLDLDETFRIYVRNAREILGQAENTADGESCARLLDAAISNITGAYHRLATETTRRSDG